MRKFGAILVPILLILSVSILGVGIVRGDPPIGTPAIVYGPPVGCWVYPDPYRISVVFILTDNVFVESASGNWKTTCNGILPPDTPGLMLPANAVKITGFPCDTPFGLTDDTVEILTPTGAVHMQCTFHG